MINENYVLDSKATANLLSLLYSIMPPFIKINTYHYEMIIIKPFEGDTSSIDIKVDTSAAKYIISYPGGNKFTVLMSDPNSEEIIKEEVLNFIKDMTTIVLESTEFKLNELKKSNAEKTSKLIRN